MDTFKAGTYIQQGHYRSFQPNGINRQWSITDPGVLNLLSQADRHLGRLDMFSQYVPNIDLFIQMHVVKEATQSSKIEGTQTNLEDALQAREAVPEYRRSDWDEVQNYIQAMHKAIAQLDELPLSTRLIKNVHRVLLQGVRGEHKQPGEFRRSQNWIGGATLNDAVFIPPTHDSVPDLMSDLEKFIHNEAIAVPDLVKIAIIHYQFETIHPFLDGNGRVGRLMIILYLVYKTILKKPILYLSDFFERNRYTYYDNLMHVRSNNDMAQWIRFFLVGVIETAKAGVETFNATLQLKAETDTALQKLGSRTGNAQKVVTHLYRQPMIDAKKVGKITGQSPATAYKLIADLERLNILKEVTGSKRGKVYAFERYLNLFKA